MENGALRHRPCCLLSTSLPSNCSIGLPRGIRAIEGLVHVVVAYPATVAEERMGPVAYEAGLR